MNEDDPVQADPSHEERRWLRARARISEISGVPAERVGPDTTITTTPFGCALQVIVMPIQLSIEQAQELIQLSMGDDREP